MSIPDNNRRRPRTRRRTLKTSELRVIPLGGLGEIGKNITAFCCGEDIIVVDCGLKFPEEDMLGIDFVIPDVQYLLENKDKIRAIFITHGHEDHIGALPFVLPRLDVPVYCSRLTKGLIDYKMQDANTNYSPKYREVKGGDTAAVGCFTVKFISVCHSIPDSMALAIKTPLGTIVHTGDFKLDPTPIDGVTTDLCTFAELGKEGVLLMMSDSTNIERSGSTPPEKTVGQTFERLFRLYRDRRIVVATFSSNLHRVQQVVNTAGRFNRKVVLAGRSMVNNVELARELGYMDIADDMLISSEEADHLSPNRVVVITTGSQGEPFSGLVLMSRGAHRSVRLGDKDLVIISATPIPGNEKLVSQTVNRLFALGCEVVYERDQKIHVSGHGSRDELTMMFSLVKPKYFMPVHGEYRHLVRHAQLARDMGVPAKNVFILQNGDVLRFQGPNKAGPDGHVEAGAVLVDGVALGEFEGSILRERRELSENGLVVISLVLDKSYKIKAPVQIQTKGSVFSSEDGGTFKDMEKAVTAAVAQLARTPGAKPEALPTEIRKRIRDVFGRTSRNYPTIVPLITKL